MPKLRVATASLGRDILFLFGPFLIASLTEWTNCDNWINWQSLSNRLLKENEIPWFMGRIGKTGFFSRFLIEIRSKNGRSLDRGILKFRKRP
tara:strand:+ start:47030 stop:47305 length:276 start_codon:yes stop_codon:yes gene_type:complete